MLGVDGDEEDKPRDERIEVVADIISASVFLATMPGRKGRLVPWVLWFGEGFGQLGVSIDRIREWNGFVCYSLGAGKISWP